MAAHYHDLDRLRPGALFGLLLTGPVAGAALGVLTNAVNGAVSPTYFRNVMDWHDVGDVWRASVAQGAFEGILCGLAAAVCFAVVVGLVSRGCSPYGLAARYLLTVAGLASGAWILGGLIAVGLATLSPEFYRHTFIGVPTTWGPLLRYAWVGGSIWGVQFGGLAALIVACVAFGTRWRRLHRAVTWRPDLSSEAQCARCGYIVKGLTEPRCPECGADLREAGVRGA